MAWPSAIMAGVAAVSMSASGVRGQALQGVAIKEWLDQAWKEASEFPPLKGKVVVWVEEGAMTFTHTYACTAEGTRWRYDLAQGDRTLDTVVRGVDVAWDSSAAKLTLMNPRDVPPPYQPKEVSRTFWPQLGRLFHGGMSLGATANVVPQEPVLSADGWSLNACLPQGREGGGRYCVQFKGGWDANRNSGFVESTTIVEHWNPDAVGTRDEHERALSSGGALAPYSNVTVLGPNGVVQRTLRLRSVRDLSTDEEAGLFRVPDPSPGQQVNDLRAGYAVIGSGPAFDVVAVDSPLANQSAAMPSNDTSAPMPRWAGWVIAAGVVTVVGGILAVKRVVAARSA